MGTNENDLRMAEYLKTLPPDIGSARVTRDEVYLYTCPSTTIEQLADLEARMACEPALLQWVKDRRAYWFSPEVIEKSREFATRLAGIVGNKSE